MSPSQTSLTESEEVFATVTDRSGCTVSTVHPHCGPKLQVSFYLPAVSPAFGSNCVTFILDYVFDLYLSYIIVCLLCHAAASRLVLFAIGQIQQTPPGLTS